MRNTIISMLIALLLMAVMPAWLLPSGVIMLSGEQNTTSQTNEKPGEQAETAPGPAETDPAVSDGGDPAPTVSDLQNKTVRVLHRATGEVEEMTLDSYLYGVVFGEMPASFGKEALRAQAIASRTYTEYRIRACAHENADLCDSAACCQNYICREDAVEAWGESIVSDAWQSVKQAVDDTTGQILLYDGKPICAVYHASSYRSTASPEEVWGGALPYLHAVSSPEEDIRAEVTLTEAEMKKALTGRSHRPVEGASPLETIKLTDSGRVLSVSLYGCEITGTELRSLLGLRSAMFEITFGDGAFRIVTHGSGHGVGMSQYGARTMALEGKSAEEILLHYYPGCTLCRAVTANRS